MMRKDDQHRRKVCRSPNCERTATARGLCLAHHKRFMKGNEIESPIRFSMRPRPPLDRFFLSMIPEPNTGCWLWTGSINRGGYGVMSINDRQVKAHRFSYQTFKGPIPSELQIDHLCRVPSCVNPDHLEAVTAKANVGRASNNNRKKAFCPKGHPYSGDNLIVERINGKFRNRRCRSCRNAS